jgi:GTP-binding protein EngB required for normal cell division
MFPNENTTGNSNAERAVDFASELAQRYELSSLAPLLASCRAAILQNEVSVAVIGRFKAGKSSFLNHFTHRAVLPVGVVPVTAVITELRFGPAERAEIHFLDGRVQAAPVDGIAAYVSERENPENLKGVKLITVELPGLERFPGLKFVDTPGLESALVHNTEEALRWLPNVGLALVAVSVDPPLSQQDIELLKKLYRFTPNVTVLLTKVDLLAPEERSEVTAFVAGQLAKAFEKAPRVAPYSIRHGYEDLRSALERDVFSPLLASFGEEGEAILHRKVDTLLRECSDYITLSLKSAELLSSEREALKERLIGQEQVIYDVKKQLRLIARDATGSTRAFADRLLQAHQKPLEDRLLSGLAAEYPKWTKSLAVLLDSFDQWLGAELRENLAMVSAAERSRLAEPLQQTARQVLRILQDFRDRLSDGTMKAFGIPLRTTEVTMEIQEPESPDIHVGKIFDRNWELLSPVVPVALVGGMIRRHFENQVSYKLFINISRLVSQWEERINSALLKLEKEAERRLDELVATVARLIETGHSDRVPDIRRDLQAIEAFRDANRR